MYVLAQVAPVAGCALMMAVCFAAMGGMSVWRRWRSRGRPADGRSVESVEALRREVQSLQEALDARGRPGSRS